MRTFTMHNCSCEQRVFIAGVSTNHTAKSLDTCKMADE